MAIGIHPRDLADRLAPNGEALAQDEIRAAERLTEFGAALLVRYLGASAYAALPATVADNALCCALPAGSGTLRRYRRGPSPIRAGKAAKRINDPSSTVSSGRLTTRKRPPTRCANPAP